MVRIYITFNTFHNWGTTYQLNTPLTQKTLPLYFLLYINQIFKNSKILIKRKLCRRLVVLKSPFHYKTPKHHIQYKYYTIKFNFLTTLINYKYVYNLLTTFFNQNKIYSTQIKKSKLFPTQNLIL